MTRSSYILVMCTLMFEDLVMCTLMFEDLVMCTLMFEDLVMCTQGSTYKGLPGTTIIACFCS